MDRLNAKLDALCVFRALLDDPVVASLRRFFTAPTVSAYAEFVSTLYTANGGDLGAYLQAAVNGSVNPYVAMLGNGQTPPVHMRAAMIDELDTLQAITQLNRKRLGTLISYDGFLPDFQSTCVHLRTEYLHRTENLAKYGYGVFALHNAFALDFHGDPLPIKRTDTVPLESLIGYTRERQAVLDNTEALLAGKPASNILLTGDAGTGKSSTVKAVACSLCAEGLRIIEVQKEQLHLLSNLLHSLADNPLKFILFIDDLTFDVDDDNFRMLNAVLEGSIEARAENAVIYATSNRRHMIRETFSDREGNDVHRNDTMQEQLSLSARFGIHISFSRPDKQTYLHIVHALASRKSIRLPEAELDRLAECYALERGGRSPRLAKQLINDLLTNE